MLLNSKAEVSRTVDLSEQLAEREGVERIIAEPYQDVAVKVNGPAIILVITD